MPALVPLTTMREERGSLTVVEKGMPFPVKRVFYTWGVPAGTIRGGHGHMKCRVALVAATGACTVSGTSRGGESWSYRLEDPSRCLLLEPGDWHQMAFEAPATVLLCFASEEYDPADYFYDRPAASR
jgi:hypothetical protein